MSLSEVGCRGRLGGMELLCLGLQVHTGGPVAGCWTNTSPLSLVLPPPPPPSLQEGVIEDEGRALSPPAT